MAERYITDRNFPDKAIDALDEAGSRVHLTNINVPKEIEEQEKLIEDARVLKAEAVSRRTLNWLPVIGIERKNFPLVWMK